MVETSRYRSIDTIDAHRVMFYLDEQGLIERGEVSHRDKFPEMLEAKITAKGIDYLNESSGKQNERVQAAIFDSSALRKFLMQSIQASDISQVEADSAIEELRNINDEKIQSLAIKLLQIAVKNPSNILSLLR